MHPQARIGNRERRGRLHFSCRVTIRFRLLQIVTFWVFKTKPRIHDGQREHFHLNYNDEASFPFTNGSTPVFSGVSVSVQFAVKAYYKRQLKKIGCITGVKKAVYILGMLTLFWIFLIMSWVTEFLSKISFVRRCCCITLCSIVYFFPHFRCIRAFNPFCISRYKTSSE